MSDDDNLLGAARAFARKAAGAVDAVEDAVEGAIKQVLRVGREERQEHPEHEEHRGCGHCSCHCTCGTPGPDDHDGDGPPGGPGGGPPGRPTRTPGHDRGDLDGTPVTVGDITGTHPGNSWPGPRKDLPLPFLFLRANAGDNGTRPAVGAFWESPDVYLLAGVHPSVAPPIPPALGQTALAGQPNTVYAHIWNFGRAAAHDVVVEFYWCNPSLGFNPTSAQLIGRGRAHLGHRGSGRSHHVVKCPEPWVPTFVNGGHECLLIRAWDNCQDLLTNPEWDASVNRHLGQRNVHVVDLGSGGGAGAGVGPPVPPLTLAVGPLFGAPATLAVQREHPANVPWLQLRTGRGVFPAPAPPTGDLGIAVGGGTAAATHTVDGDGNTVTLHAGDDPPPAGSAHVYRVTASQGGAPFGGYTVVVLG